MAKWILTVWLCVAATALPCRAEEPSSSSQPPAEQRARVHFLRGVELYREGNYDAALAEFEMAHKISPNPKILYNLAQVQIERHEYVAATKLMRDFLDQSGPDLPNEKRAAVEEDLLKMQQRLASLTVVVDVDDAQIFVNDQPVGVSPLSAALLVNVGTIRVRAEKTGYTSQVATLNVAGAEQYEVKLALPRVSAPEPTPLITAPVTTTRVNMAPFWISAGATVALGAATATFGILALGADDDLDKELSRYPGRPSQLDAAQNKLQRFAILTDAFAAGTVVAAGFAIYFLVDPPTHSDRRADDGVRARLLPTPGGLSLSGQF